MGGVSPGHGACGRAQSADSMLCKSKPWSPALSGLGKPAPSDANYRTTEPVTSPRSALRSPRPQESHWRNGPWTGGPPGEDEATPVRVAQRGSQRGHGHLSRCARASPGRAHACAHGALRPAGHCPGMRGEARPLPSSGSLCKALSSTSQRAGRPGCRRRPRGALVPSDKWRLQVLCLPDPRHSENILGFLWRKREPRPVDTVPRLLRGPRVLVLGLLDTPPQGPAPAGATRSPPGLVPPTSPSCSSPFRVRL